MLAAEFAANVIPIWQGAPWTNDTRIVGWIEARFQIGVRHGLRERPGEAARPRSLNAHPNPCAGHGQSADDLTVAQFELEVHSKNVFDLVHRQPVCGHGYLLAISELEEEERRPPSLLSHAKSSGLTFRQNATTQSGRKFKSGCVQAGTGGCIRPESVAAFRPEQAAAFNWNRWLRSTGIRTVGAVGS